MITCKKSKNYPLFLNSLPLLLAFYDLQKMQKNASQSATVSRVKQVHQLLEEEKISQGTNGNAKQNRNQK